MTMNNKPANDHTHKDTTTDAIHKRKSASKKLVRGSALMLFGRLFSIVINFAVQVVTVRYLIKSDFGAFAYAMSIVTIGSSIAVFGLGKTISRFVPIYQEHKQFREMAGTVLLALASATGIGLFLMLVFYGLRGVTEPYLASDPLSVGLLLALIILCPVQAIESVFESMFAIFASPMELFARRFLIGPLLKFCAVLPLLLFHSNVWLLAWSNVVAGLIGILYSSFVMFHILRKSDLLVHFRLSTIQLPIKTIFGYSAPMVISDLLPTVRVAMVSIILEMFHGTMGVASFRAVVPLARLNQAPRDSFRLLFTPTLSRMFARGDREGVEHAYWQSSIWIAVITFPFFIASFALSKQLAIFIFGAPYADSAGLLAVLSLGYYLSAAFGFSAYTLRVYGHMRRSFFNDISTAVLTIALGFALIPSFGMTGGACVTAASLLIGVVLNKLAVIQYGIIRSIDRATVQSLIAITMTTCLIVMLKVAFEPSMMLSLFAALASTVIVVLASLPALDVGSTFPELSRFIPFREKMSMQTVTSKP